MHFADFHKQHIHHLSSSQKRQLLIEDMTPKQVVETWLIAFNNADIETLAGLYAVNATNHQVANEPVIGIDAIKKMFATEFAKANMICMPENIFEDGDWAILEWTDPKGLRGCGFFNIKNDKIVFQRGYWDKLSFYKLYNANPE